MKRMAVFRCIALLIVAGQGCFSFGQGLNSWHWRNPLPQGNWITGFAQGKGLIVAAAARGVVTSPDGTNWASHPLPASVSVTAIAFGNGTFTAVGSAIITSSDGTNWTIRST